MAMQLKKAFGRNSKRLVALSAAVAGVGFLSSGRQAHATDYQWSFNAGNAGSGLWATGTNWTVLAGPGTTFPDALGPAGSGDTATFGNAIGTNTVTINLSGANRSLGATFGGATGQ